MENLSQLRHSINTAKSPATILLADGSYTLDGSALHIRTDGLVIRSASGDRDKVVVRDTLSHNLGSARPEWFADLTSGDLHLTRHAGPALDAGEPGGTFNDDIDGERRPAGDSWDIGADEFHRTVE